MAAAPRGVESPQGISAGLACKKGLFDLKVISLRGLKAVGRVVQVLFDKIERTSPGGKDLSATVIVCAQ